MRKEMHQCIKAALHQEMKQMTPSPLKDKDVSGKVWLEVGQGLTVSVLNTDNGSINAVVTKGAPLPFRGRKAGHPVILRWRSGAQTPGSKGSQCNHLCGNSFQAHE